jgi:mannosylglucosylglycerate synthase
MPRVAIVSYRLGGADGVSVEAAKWAHGFTTLGFDVSLVAGAGPDPVVNVAGLGIEPSEHVDLDALNNALAQVDLVVVENLCSLPLNPTATRSVAKALMGRPAILRHHDLPWQRTSTASFGPPPTDPAWTHVTINKRSQEELLHHGIESTCLYNRFDLDPPSGDRELTRGALDLSAEDRLALQPTRALPRKNVPEGLRVASELRATYWLTGAAEDGFAPELEKILDGATTRVLRGPGPGTIDDAYAASDAVLFPSTWEGFGNPVLESVAHRRPLLLGDYPVAGEIRSFGFEFFEPSHIGALEAFLREPEESLFDRNLAIARAHFDLADLPRDLEILVASVL